MRLEDIIREIEPNALEEHVRLVADKIELNGIDLNEAETESSNGRWAFLGIGIAHNLHLIDNGRYATVNTHNNFWTKVRDAASYFSPAKEVVDGLEGYWAGSIPFGFYEFTLSNARMTGQFTEEIKNAPKPKPEQQYEQFHKEFTEYWKPLVEQKTADANNPRADRLKRMELLVTKEITPEDIKMYSDLNDAAKACGYKGIQHVFAVYKNTQEDSGETQAHIALARAHVNSFRRMAAILDPLYKTMEAKGYARLG
jgi:hypothetical protein